MAEQKNALMVIQKELESPNIMRRIETRLGQKAGSFVTSLLDVCADDQKLMECNPKLIVKEAMKAAALDLPISKALGFAYLIPYKEKGIMTPHFQPGYKGYNQLAVRSGQYKHLNADAVYEGETVIVDKIRGTMEITGEPKSDKAIGFFAYMKLTNGFEKAIFWTRERVEGHARKFSQSYNNASSPWKKDFVGMACKTMLLQLVPKYGPMTIEMTMALESDASDYQDFDRSLESDISDNAGTGDFIDITDGEGEAGTEEPTEDQIKGGIVNKLTALQELNQEAFDAARKGVVAKVKPFDLISVEEFEKISVNFTEIVNSENAGQ